MAGLESSLWIVGSYIAVFVLIYVVLNFLTKGFIGQYLKVKISRGRLILVKCYDVTDTFYKAGMVNARRNLIIKDRLKNIHTFSGIDKMFIGRELGLNIIEVDLVKGILIKKDFTTATAYDLTMVDEMVNRALMLPKLNKDLLWENLQKLFFIIIIIGIGVLIYLVATLEPTCTVASQVGI